MIKHLILIIFLFNMYMTENFMIEKKSFINPNTFDFLNYPSANYIGWSLVTDQPCDMFIMSETEFQVFKKENVTKNIFFQQFGVIQYTSLRCDDYTMCWLDGGPYLACKFYFKFK
jgi:hypothetical protein